MLSFSSEAASVEKKRVVTMIFGSSRRVRHRCRILPEASNKRGAGSSGRSHGEHRISSTTRREQRAQLFLISSNQMVIVWLQQLKPEWCYLAQSLSRLSHTLGEALALRARILFDGPSSSAQSDNEAAGKGCAVKSAKVDHCAKRSGIQSLA